MSKIYVGTYRKYNNGSLHGAWLDLEDFSGKEEFLKACEELHSDEDQPELMFQDWEGIPSSFITESSIDERTWDWLDLDADARQAVASYLEQVDHCSDIAAALECHEGVHESEQDWARDFWDQTGMASELIPVQRTPAHSVRRNTPACTSSTAWATTSTRLHAISTLEANPMVKFCWSW